MCQAEKECIDKACTGAYDFNATEEFPYTINYTKTGDALSSTFVFEV